METFLKIVFYVVVLVMGFALVQISHVYDKVSLIDAMLFCVGIGMIGQPIADLFKYVAGSKTK